MTHPWRWRILSCLLVVLVPVMTNAKTPTISSLSPTSGAVGTSVTISGSNFGSTQGSSKLTFSGTTATPTSWSASSIVAPVPAGATTGNVVVTVAGAASNGVSFTVLPPPPSISSFSPTSGVAGTSVTINGSNFGSTQGSSTVIFFNNATATISSWNATSIVALVPATATTGNVVVSVGGQTSNGVTFTVIPSPTISSLSPTSGPVATSVTISGSNFGATQGNSYVTFNGTQVPVSFWSANSMVFSVPAGAGIGVASVAVTIGGQTSNSASFTVTPGLTSLSALAGPVGSSVTITGNNFGTVQGNSYVAFSGTQASVSSWSATSIVASVPPLPAGHVFVAVTVAGIGSNTLGFTVTPVINALSPSLGPVGTVVTITGGSFGATQGFSYVTFNGQQATPTSWSDSSIVVPVPATATTGNVVVTVGGVNGPYSNGANFTVIPPPPSISALSPTSGGVDTAVTITGSNFGASQGNSTVSFNGTAASVSSWSANSIVAYVPYGATTGNVVVTVGGQASNGVNFTVIAPPNISGLSSTSGAIGTAVTITGTNFGASQGSSTVAFNGTLATPTSWSNTSIVVPVPTGASTGNLEIEVCSQGNSCQLSNDVLFTIVGHYISGLSPTSGVLGTAVTISGSGFGATQGNSSVTFNGLYAAVTSWSDTSIVTQAPVGNTTGNVVVTVNAQASNGVSFTGVGPNITSISPTSGAVGASITITGSHFGATACNGGSSGCASVTFNGLYAPVSSWSDTSIVVPVPPGNTTGNVLVTISNGTTATNGSQVSNAVAFTGVPPNITSISPTSGPVGASVTITGSHFGATACNGGSSGCASVTFNGLYAPVSSWSDTTIVVPVPPGNTTGNVVVTISNGTTAANGSQVSNAVPFTGVPPSITSISPTSGAMGTAVTITGSHFGATQCNGTNSTCVAFVTFNGALATVSSWSDTSIVVAAPPGNTTGNVVVTISNGTIYANGTQSSNGVPFAGVPPSITSISPTSGAAGASITITGSHFGATSSSSTGSSYSSYVIFNGLYAAVTSWSDTSIVATVPQGNTTGNVVVRIDNYVGINIQSSQFSNGVPFTGQTPTISSLAPISGLVGASITITGNYFGTSAGTVTFNGYAASILSWSNTSIVASVPTPATTGNVLVIAGNQASNGVIFTVLPPAIATISPTSAGVGIPVTITGSNFGPSQGTSTLTFNGTPAPITSWTQTSIVTAVPATTTGNVVLTENGQASNALNFSVLPPNIAFLLPNSGSAGTLVTISGSNFGPTQGSGGLTFNGTVVTPRSWTANSITALLPAGVTTGNVVITAGSQTSNPMLFTVGAPTITSLSVTSGGPGTAITISGANFGATQGSSTITLNGTPATPTTWTSDSITTLVPAAATTGNLVVTVAGQASNGVVFTVTTAPGISNLTPPLGAVGTSVTIAGSNFGATQGSVTFNGMPAAPTSWSASSIAVPVPTGATTGNVVVTVGGQASNGVTFDVSTNVISYAYDDVGRLIGVVDPAGNVATYSYDAVGNILSISRQGSGQVTILSFTPSSGFAGSSVTISGSGFSPVTGQNTVQFDGVSATIISATPTQLVATVPNGAGTGPITVTSPAGAATSSTNFSVPNGLVPVITSITPGIAVAGTMVTIAGNNFDPLPANDLTTFNITRQFQQSVTATSISAAIPPNTGSGRITLSTPIGKTVSSQDLYVPRSSYNSLCCYSATDVGYTGRITPGGSQTVNFPLPGGAQIVMMLFDAVAGQQASITATPSPSSTQCGTGLYDPTNQGISTDFALPSTGTYSIVIVQSNTSGSCTIGLNLTPPPVTGTIQPGGPPVTITIANPGQYANLAFYATRNQKLSISVSSASFTSYTISCNNNCSGFVPWGGQGGSGVASGGQSTFFDTTTIPAPGKYNLIIQPGSTGVTTGTITLQLNNDSDVTGTIVAGGPPVTVTTKVPGQDARLTFSGTSGERVAVSISNVTNPQASVALLNPDGSPLSTSVSINSSGGSFFLDTLTLPTTGTYTLWVAHGGSVNTGYTGSETLQISNISDETGTISPGGTAVTATTTVPGQDVRLTFSGIAGQKISLLTSNVTNPAATVAVLNPDGTTLVSGAIKNSGGPFFLDTHTLPANGTYTVWVQHSGVNTGSETLQLYNDSDITGAITPSGAAVTETTVPGQDVRLTFSGTAGQKVSLMASNVTNPGAYFFIIEPDGVTYLGGGGNFISNSGGPVFLDLTGYPLPTTGTYTVWVQHNGANAGSETLQLYDDTDLTGTISVGGPAVTKTTVPGQDVRLTFSGTAGQDVSVGVSNISIPFTTGYVLNPSDTSLGTTTINNPVGLIVIEPGLNNGSYSQTPPTPLPTTGTYTVWMQHSGANAGSETLQMYNAPPVTGTVTVNGSPVTTAIVPGQSASLTFSGRPGQQVTVHLTNSTLGAVSVVLNSSTGTLTQLTSGSSSFNLPSVVLPARATYTISISPVWNFGGTAGSVSVTVTNP